MTHYSSGGVLTGLSERMKSCTSAYTTEQTGTPSSMPSTPKAPPPTVTAASTHRPGRPTD